MIEASTRAGRWERYENSLNGETTLDAEGKEEKGKKAITFSATQGKLAGRQELGSATSLRNGKRASQFTQEGPVLFDKLLAVLCTGAGCIESWYAVLRRMFPNVCLPLYLPSFNLVSIVMLKDAYK